MRNYCSHVFVDFAKSRNKDHPCSSGCAPSALPFQYRIFSRGARLKPTHHQCVERRKRPGLAGTGFLVDDVGAIFQRVSEGGSPNVIRLKKSVEPVVESMSRNPTPASGWPDSSSTTSTPTSTPSARVSGRSRAGRQLACPGTICARWRSAAC